LIGQKDEKRDIAKIRLLLRNILYIFVVKINLEVIVISPFELYAQAVKSFWFIFARPSSPKFKFNL